MRDFSLLYVIYEVIFRLAFLVIFSNPQFLHCLFSQSRIFFPFLISWTKSFWLFTDSFTLPSLNKRRLYFHEILQWHRFYFCIKAWRMGPNIGGIRLLSGHLHGCEGQGEKRKSAPPASWGDSSAGGWHVTAVTVLEGEGGGQPGDLLRPWSNYATRPPVRPSSLTPATLRTVLISCQEDQLPSLTIRHHWTFHNHPAITPHFLPSTHPYTGTAIHSPKSLLPSLFTVG